MPLPLTMQFLVPHTSCVVPGVGKLHPCPFRDPSGAVSVPAALTLCWLVPRSASQPSFHPLCVAVSLQGKGNLTGEVGNQVDAVKALPPLKK